MTGPFRLISADPAWRFSDKLPKRGPRRGAAANYATMSVEEICALPVGQLADTDAVLVLWRPSALVKDALRVVDAWGFEVKTEIVWYKVRPSGKAHFGMGRITRAACETAFVCTRGRPKPTRRNVRNVFVAPPMRHSAKLDAVQTTFAELFPGPALELWARRDLGGPWTCIGNECPSTFGRDLRDVLAEMTAAKAA